MSRLMLIGAGLMSQEYARVLIDQGISFDVFGRGLESSKSFLDKIGKPVLLTHFSEHYKESLEIPTAAIVAVSNDQLATVASELINFGVKRILLEKPGALNYGDLQRLYLESVEQDATLLIGFNRRFYSSTLAAEEIIKNDGGLSSVRFQFTEWVHQVLAGSYTKNVLEKWVLSNPIHVLDLFIFLSGRPFKNSSYITGSSNWHPSSMQFCGSGITDKNVIYSYHADWSSAGRWGIELYTKSRKLLLSPMEELQEVKIQSVNLNSIRIDDELDIKFKPGIYRQVKSFLNADDSRFCTLKQQVENFHFYYEMAGYRS